CRIGRICAPTRRPSDLINLTPTTEAVVRVHGTFDDYIGPISGGSDLYRKMLRVSPVRFPAYYLPDETYSRAPHILFGGFEADQRSEEHPFELQSRESPV